MKSLELENQSLHKGVYGLSPEMFACFVSAVLFLSIFLTVLCLLVVENLRAALQKLESRVVMLEKTPAAVPCAKVL